MTKDETKELIFAVTQSVLSLVIVVGGGLFLFQNPDSNNTPGIIAFVSAVLTFYFSQAINTSATNNALKTQAETKRTTTEVKAVG